MKHSKNRFILSVVAAFALLLSVGYFSCQKGSGTALACDGVSCQNGGYCLKGQCMCPTGYVDSTCSTAIVSKFVGAWNVWQVCTGSDNPAAIGKDSAYVMTIKASATPTAFLLYNFMGNNEYSQLVCTISPTNSYNFTIDTITNAAMRFANISFNGGGGTFYLAKDGSDSVIVGSYWLKDINALAKWETDTFSLAMSIHRP